MSDPIAWTVYQGETPDPTATPVLAQYRSSGGARSAPTITHLGNGVFAFTPSDDDRAVGTVAFIDNGVGREPRYVTKAIHGEANPFAAWAIFNADGSPFSGAGSPAFTLYDDARTGAPITPPAITALVSPYLWTFKPSQAALASGIGWQIANPVGAYSPYLSGDLEALEASVLQAAQEAGTTIEAILDDARAALAQVESSRGRGTFLPHKTSQPFSSAPISKTEGFEVVARNHALTAAFGKFGNKEGEFSMVVRLGQAPASTDDTRENLLQSDAARIADIFEFRTWPEGVQALFYSGVEIDKSNPVWWQAEISFRVVYFGKIRT